MTCWMCLLCGKQSFVLLSLVVCPVTFARESLLTERNSISLSQLLLKLVQLSIFQICIQIFIAMQSADGEKSRNK